MTMYADIKEHLIASTLMDAYTFQSVFNEQNMVDTKRYCLMLKNGRAGDKFVRNASYQIWLIGKVNDGDVAGIESDAEAITKYVLNNPNNGCVINLQLLLDPSGPKYTESGRVAYSFELGVKYIDTI